MKSLIVQGENPVSSSIMEKVKPKEGNSYVEIMNNDQKTFTKTDSGTVKNF